MQRICNEENVEILSGAVASDHVHLLTSIDPSTSVLKLAQRLVGGEFWSDGYLISTISEKGNWQAVEAYVRNQEKMKQ